jgi:oligoribonuclease NrnB/cAMP/cGMP phosphodiesterase (DHH superfamily)
MKNIAIIYHDADFDGKLSNEVCRFHLRQLYPNAAIHSYGWDYGRPVPSVLLKWWDDQCGDQFSNKWEDYDAIYIVDLSVDELMGRPELRGKIVWIDHHKSAIEKWDHIGDITRLVGYRIDGVAACRLCWQWFTADTGPHGDPRIHPADRNLPQKHDYVGREVSEPELIRLAGEYDIWDHRDPAAKALQFGLRALHDESMAVFVHGQFDSCGDAQEILDEVVQSGHSIKSYCDRQNDEYSAAYSRTLDWEGLKFCCLNIGQRGNSDLLCGGLKLEHQACFAWRHTGDGVMVSLYHIEGHTDIDLSKIAVKYGGGGHRGACGFRITLSELDRIITP